MTIPWELSLKVGVDTLVMGQLLLSSFGIVPEGRDRYSGNGSVAAAFFGELSLRVEIDTLVMGQLLLPSLGNCP